MSEVRLLLLIGAMVACHKSAPESPQAVCVRLGISADAKLEECGYRMARSRDTVERDCAGYSEQGRRDYINDFYYVIAGKTCDAVKLREDYVERRRMEELRKMTEGDAP